VSGEPQPLGEPQSDSTQLKFASDGRRFTFVERHFSSSVNQAEFDPQRDKFGEPKPIKDGLASRPDISLDRRVVFNFKTGNNEDLYSSRLDGQDYHSLASDPAMDRGPRWSPDGKHVAYFSNRSGSLQIWLADSSGNNPRQITDRKNSLYPVWSPKGDELIATVLASSPIDYRSFKIKLGPDLRAASTEALPPLGNSDESFTAWSWSSDGTMLAGYRQGRDGRARGITIYNFATRQYRDLTDYGSDPVWLHLSPRLMFVHDGKLYLSGIGEHPNPKMVLSHAPDKISRRGFSISPDDRTIVFGLDKFDSKLWMGALAETQVAPNKK
jgi:Tol biopolymer transport system component